ncbi:tetratricopeptide repeat protein [Flavobacteriaceae bacterium D16]|nr:tetratricopeptide repeat protein [Flavobacteriaceae bacterium D16]
MNKLKYTISFIVIVSCCLIAKAQETAEDPEQEKALQRSTNLTWEANKELSENNFVGAEADYRKAISKSTENIAAPYNLGSAYYNRESFSEAFGRFKQAGELATEKTDKHKAFHNLGNVFMKNKEYQKAVEAYKEALRNNPSDEETRYNLALAKEMLKKDQQNQQNQDDQEDQDQKDQKDQNQDQQDNKGQQEQDQNQDQQQGDQEKEENKEGEGEEKQEQDKQPQENDGEQKKQPKPSQLSPQQIKNLLEAMQNEEKKVQEKMDAKKVKGAKIKNVKDW